MERLRILRGVDLAVSPGASLAIEGRSGSGKTTLLAALGLLATVDSGEVWVARWRADNLSDAARARLRNQHIGFVFQSYSLIRHLSAQANVALPLIGLSSVAERARELVIRPAMGGTRTQVVLQLLLAAAAIGAITAVLAVGAGIAGLQVWAPTASIATTVVGAAIPALVAARLDIAAALRD